MKEKGFSVIELMIGLTVLVTITAIGIPSFKTSIGNSQIKTVAESVKYGLQIARIEAIKRNAKVSFTLNGNTNWQVGCQTVDTTCPAIIQTKPASEGSSSNISVVITSGNTVIFNSFGLRDAASTITQIDVNNSSMDSVESRPLRILINSGGNARVCDTKVTTVGDPRKC